MFDQLIAHAVGDYLLQSHWMATEKTKRWLPAILHVLTYMLPFLLLDISWSALLVIAGTHLLIDRFRLTTYISWARNGYVRPKTPSGYPIEAPVWLTTWLMIITDNLVHILINALAIQHLG